MLWCTTRYGDVLHIDPATGAYDTVLELDVYGGNGEPGLLGMALHPDWDTTPEVFLVYTQGSWIGGTSEQAEQIHLEWIELVDEQILHSVEAGGIHNGSRLLVLPDNTLLMTTGDVGDGGVSSQSDNSDNGKVLRFNLDGSVPPTTPPQEVTCGARGTETPKASAWPQRTGLQLRARPKQLGRIQHH